MHTPVYPSNLLTCVHIHQINSHNVQYHLALYIPCCGCAKHLLLVAWWRGCFTLLEVNSNKTFSTWTFTHNCLTKIIIVLPSVHVCVCVCGCTDNEMLVSVRMFGFVDH